MTNINPGKLGLTTKILLGMCLGALLGFVLRFTAGEAQWVSEYFTHGIFDVIGGLFVSALRMLVVPLVFVSLVCGTASLADPSTLGRIGGKTLALYLLTTAIAISLALGAATLFQPGDPIMQAAAAGFEAKTAPSLADVVIGLIPRNPMAAMSEGNMLQIIVFSILFGYCIAQLGDKASTVRRFFTEMDNVMMNLVNVVMWFAPYGVFGLIAKMALTLDLAAFGSVIKYFFLVLGVLFVHALVVYPMLLTTLSGLNPITFLKKMGNVQMFAFSTASSAATLPVTMENAKDNLGIGNRVSSFTLPLGATVNMDGTAIMQGVATVFIAQVFSVDLSAMDMLMVILTATLASIGTAGVPGVGLIMLAMVLQQVNLPVEGIALILGVDRLLDMVRTAVNVTGDTAVSLIVANSEKDLNKETFKDPDALEKVIS
ncbi:dicarboxylate/amino acid:cation symporter [Ferrimonas lipolytica]|uniref:Dicarboxylate/amino acid:cation symporter n=1 Tax=Ferrimonas lipolytica TaxID=2724191 RepID=A0A6H1UA09_9GAMM|nr:dicarboxylate/amino acid:cation symporter [Ferrimonas lipolytica]QIZ75881.1 dicarboxylate/amino acid:cation symporter [Ferrimonas lipolytica]